MSSRSRKFLGIGAAVVVVGAAVVIATSTGGNDSHEDKTTANADGAFITSMIPHHQSAVQMAQIALQRGRHPEVTQLATNIVSSQSQEIDQMNKMHQRLFGSTADAMHGQHGSAGMSEKEMGMDMDPAELKTAKPFDRAFIDMMIPHHQGAIRMARVEIPKGGDREATRLAQTIIIAQAKEISDMNSWRKKWYGEASPAGGVPKGTSNTDGSSDTGHSGQPMQMR